MALREAKLSPNQFPIKREDYLVSKPLRRF